MQRIKSLFKDESGVETIEYAIVAGVIAVLAAAAYTGLGATIKTYVEGLLQ